MINNTVTDYSKLNLTNVGKPKVSGITNLSLVPDSVKKNAAVTTTKPKATTQSVVSPAKAPVAPVSSGSAGTYKGVAINSGSDADIAEQIRRIDAGSSSTSAPVKGLLPSVQGSIKGSTPAPVSTAPTYSGLVQTLAERAQTPSKQVQDAFEAQQGRAAALRKFRESTAETTRGVYSAPTSARVMQGRDQALQQANFQREAALGSELTAATDLYGASLTGQGQELTALGQAAGLAAPQLGSIGQVPYNPMDLSQGAILGSTQPGGLIGAGQLLGQFQGAQAVGAAPGATQAQNIQTGGTAQVGAAAQGYTQAIQNYNTLNTINASAHAQAQNVQQILASAGLNQGIPDYNKAINKLSGKLGSANVQAFNTAIAEMQNMYSQILATGGGTPTGQEQTALMALNPNSSAAQINAAIQQLEIAAYNKLNAQYQQAQQYQANLGGQSGGSQSGTITWDSI